MNNKPARTSYNNGLHMPGQPRTRTELRAGRLAMPNSCKNRARRHQQQGEQRIEAAANFLLPCPTAAAAGDRSTDGGHAGHIIGLPVSGPANRGMHLGSGRLKQSTTAAAIGPRFRCHLEARPIAAHHRPKRSHLAEPSPPPSERQRLLA